MRGNKNNAFFNQGKADTGPEIFIAAPKGPPPQYNQEPHVPVPKGQKTHQA